MKYATPRMQAMWTDDALSTLWWTIELAVLKAQSMKGIVPEEWADQMAEVSPPTIEAWRMAEAECGHEVVGWLQAFEAAGAKHVHIGMTSSDLTDTALAIRVNLATDVLLESAHRLLEAMDSLIDTVGDAPRLARTHGQPAIADTFGRRLTVLKDQFGRCVSEVDQIPGKLSGPVGSHDTRPVGMDIEELVLGAFNLLCDHQDIEHNPEASQIVPRDFIARWANCMSTIASSTAAIAMEIRLLAQDAIGEVAEGRGTKYEGSSAMPHKRNPSQSERITGLARMVRVMALALNEGIEQWNDRDLAHSSVEREFVPLVAATTEYAVALMADIIANLVVDTGRMALNLDLARDRIGSHDLQVALQLDGKTYTEAAAAAKKESK